VRADLAALGVDRHDGVGVEVVAFAHASIEVRAGVAGIEIKEVQLGVERGGGPAVPAAARPSLPVGGPGLGPGLSRGRNHVAPPDALAGLELEGVGVTAHAELPSGAADDHHVLDDQRRHRRALTGPYVAERLVPDALARLGVQREHVGVEGRDEHLPIGHGAAAIDVAAAQRHVVRGRVLAAPQLGSRPGVEGPYPSVPAGDVHDPVDDDRRRLERVRRRARVHAHRAALERPRGSEAPDVAGVDLVDRAVALTVVGAVVREPVVRLRARVEDALVADALGDRRRAPDHRAQRPEVDGRPCVYVLSLGCHQLLLSTVGAEVDGRDGLPPGPRRSRRSCRSDHVPRRYRSATRTSSSPDHRG